jgi:hypothetical protein
LVLSPKQRVSVASARKYRSGERRPPVPVFLALQEALRARARECLALAGDIDSEVWM